MMNTSFGWKMKSRMCREDSGVYCEQLNPRTCFCYPTFDFAKILGDYPLPNVWLDARVPGIWI